MNKIIIHIPHSSIYFPKLFYKNILINKKQLKFYSKKMSDIKTNKIFKTHFTTIQAKYNRMFCDVERYIDDNKEIMSKFGQGVIYTHTFDGINFINYSSSYKNKIIKNYYTPYHNRIDKIISENKNKNIYFFDCHSFSEQMAKSIGKINCPDICIGYNNDFEKKVACFCKNYFENLGYSVKFNYPYSGSYTPNICMQDSSIKLISVMIEINKRLYIINNRINRSKIKTLNKKLKELFKMFK